MNSFFLQVKKYLRNKVLDAHHHPLESDLQLVLPQQKVIVSKPIHMSKVIILTQTELDEMIKVSFAGIEANKGNSGEHVAIWRIAAL
jgi:hypothetical protein